jgi:hypothetical protein
MKIIKSYSAALSAIIQQLQPLRSHKNLNSERRSQVTKYQSQVLDELKQIREELDTRWNQFLVLSFSSDLLDASDSQTPQTQYQPHRPLIELRESLDRAIGSSERVIEATFMQPITTEEKRAIFAAMRVDLGGDGRRGGFGSHWNLCRNGHVYLIGECGGAMVSGRCNECGVEIGGANHTRVADNRDATDFLREVGQ